MSDPCEFLFQKNEYLYDNNGEKVVETIKVYTCLLENMIDISSGLHMSCVYPNTYCEYKAQKEDFKEACGKIIFKNLEEK